MAYIDRVQPHDTTLNQKQLNLLRRIVQKKWILMEDKKHLAAFLFV